MLTIAFKRSGCSMHGGLGNHLIKEPWSNPLWTTNANQISRDPALAGMQLRKELKRNGKYKNVNTEIRNLFTCSKVYKM